MLFCPRGGVSDCICFGGLEIGGIGRLVEELTGDGGAGVQGFPVTGAELQRYGAGGCRRPV